MAFNDKAKKVQAGYARVLREIQQADTDLQDALTVAEQREQRDTARREAGAQRMMEGRNA